MKSVAIALLCVLGSHVSVAWCKRARVSSDEIAALARKYPKAPSFSDDLSTPSGKSNTQERIREMMEKLKKDDETVDEQEAEQQFQDLWALTVQVGFEASMNMGCANMCAICVPTEEDFESEGDFDLKSLLVTRQKGIVSSIANPVVSVLNRTAGLIVGTIGGGILGGLGGIGALAVVGGATHDVVVNSMVSNVTGHVLGALAGLITGTISGTAALAGSTLLGAGVGVTQGAGLTGVTTSCKRVGFESAEGGLLSTSQNFGADATSGMEKLREAMGYDKNFFDDNSGDVIVPHDDPQFRDYVALSHCEHMRDFNFDIRHAGQCVKHSNLCGKNGGLMLPIPLREDCKQMSNMALLNKLAGSGESPLLEQWRKLNEKKQKRAKCVKVLCACKGYKKASLISHTDKTVNLPEEEQVKLAAGFKYIGDCKDTFELTLDKPDERENVCPELSEAGDDVLCHSFLRM